MKNLIVKKLLDEGTIGQPFYIESRVQGSKGIPGDWRCETIAGGGMLFDWGTPRDSAMWMRNTITSLDMVFINADGTIRRIAERTVPLSLATVESRGPVRATLELAAGTAERLNLHPGDKVLQRLFGNVPAP